MKHLLTLLSFLVMTSCLYAQTPWYCGTWKGSNGDMMQISKAVDYDGYVIFTTDGNHGAYFGMGTPKIRDGKLTAEVGDAVDGFEAGQLFFYQNNNSIAWDDYSCIVTYHKDSSIAGRVRDAKLRFDAAEKVRQEMKERIEKEHARIAAILIAKNPWVLGTWGLDGQEILTIRKDGRANDPYGHYEVINPFPEESYPSIVIGEMTVIYIDWDKRTVKNFDNIQLQKIR